MNRFSIIVCRMPIRALAALLLLNLPFGSALASDACSTRAIATMADVAVSDGSAFKTESYFHSRDAAAIRHFRDKEQTIAVEGPLAWARADGDEQVASEFHKNFALGHQFHAFLLHFDEIVDNPRKSDAVSLDGEEHKARTGDYPYGGTVHRLEGASASRPSGLVFEFPGMGPIEVSFSDWRTLDESEMPFLIEVDDGERVFNYRYTHVDTAARSPLWFFDSVSAPALDEVQIYRLHRTQLAAHCLGDADLMAENAASEIVSANRGQLTSSTNESMRERFTSVFEAVDYTEYHDISLPIIEVAESGDLGWIGVNIRAVATVIETGEPFDMQWAWIQVVRKVDGRWVSAGNASNMLDE